MNPHQSFPTSPKHLASSFWVNRDLILQMTKRDIHGKYKGSVVGLGWSLFNPMLMLAVYTFVFSVIFKARWGVQIGDSKSEFAIILFAGLILHGLFSEVVNRAPSLILGNVNYVKKVVFPLEILPMISTGTALFHAFVGSVVLISAVLLTEGSLPLTAICVPVVVLPLVLMTLGFAWFFASLGVYLRDIGQAIGILTTIMLFLAPVFYPLEFLPEKYRSLIFINPLTFPIEQLRAVLLFNLWPNWSGMAIYFAFSAFIGWAGFYWFQKSRKGFADTI